MIFRRMISFSAIFSLILGGVFSSGSHGSEVKTNLEVVNDISTEIVEELISTFPPSVSERGVVIVPYAEDETHEFITGVWIKTLAARGIKVYVPSEGVRNGRRDSGPISSGAGDAIRLKFQNMNFELKYTKVFRSHLIGGKRVKRYANIKVFAQLIDPQDKSVLTAREIGKDYMDKFPYADIDEVEEGSFSFTKPEHIVTKWSRFVEPVVVSGIIVGLIYLFFSNQSGD